MLHLQLSALQQPAPACVRPLWARCQRCCMECAGSLSVCAMMGRLPAALNIAAAKVEGGSAAQAACMSIRTGRAAHHMQMKLVALAALVLGLQA